MLSTPIHIPGNDAASLMQSIYPTINTDLVTIAIHGRTSYETSELLYIHILLVPDGEAPSDINIEHYFDPRIKQQRNMIRWLQAAGVTTLDAYIEKLIIVLGHVCYADIPKIPEAKSQNLAEMILRWQPDVRAFGVTAHIDDDLITDMIAFSVYPATSPDESRSIRATSLKPKP